MCNCKINASECLVQCDFFLNQKVSTLSLVQFVRLLLHNDHHITRFNTWILISLTVEGILLVIWCTFVNLSSNYLFLLHNLFALTVLALVFLIDYFALTTAIVTWTS